MKWRFVSSRSTTLSTEQSYNGSTVVIGVIMIPALDTEIWHSVNSQQWARNIELENLLPQQRLNARLGGPKMMTQIVLLK